MVILSFLSGLGTMLCELANSKEGHEKLLDEHVTDLFLQFITTAGGGLNGHVCVELLVGAVLGLSTLVTSPTCIWIHAIMVNKLARVFDKFDWNHV